MNNAAGHNTPDISGTLHKQDMHDNVNNLLIFAFHL
jgi:hypothetical protein